MARIQIRSDTAERWALYNPILASGEFGYDKTNEVVKVGDGVTPWSELDIITGLKLSLQDIAIADIQVKNAEGVKINPSTQEGQQAILDRLNDPLPVSINNSLATIKSAPVTGAKTITSTAAEVFAGASRLANRYQMTIQNTGTLIIYIGAAGATVENGFPLLPGDSITLAFKPDVATPIYAISTGSNTVRVVELA